MKQGMRCTESSATFVSKMKVRHKYVSNLSNYEVVSKSRSLPDCWSSSSPLCTKESGEVVQHEGVCVSDQKINGSHQLFHLLWQFTFCVSLTFSSQSHQLVRQRPCHVLSCQCENACKRCHQSSLAEWLRQWANLGLNTTTKWLEGHGIESHSRHE